MNRWGPGTDLENTTEETWRIDLKESEYVDTLVEWLNESKTNFAADNKAAAERIQVRIGCQKRQAAILPAFKRHDSLDSRVSESKADVYVASKL